MDFGARDRGEVARICSVSGALIVPVETAYERELLFESVEQSTRRYGTVCLTLGRCRWTVTVAAGSSQLCTACSHVADPLIYTRARWRLCAICARRVAPTSTLRRIGASGPEGRTATTEGDTMRLPTRAAKRQTRRERTGEA